MRPGEGRAAQLATARPAGQQADEIRRSPAPAGEAPEPSARLGATETGEPGTVRGNEQRAYAGTAAPRGYRRHIWRCLWQGRSSIQHARTGARVVRARTRNRQDSAAVVGSDPWGKTLARPRTGHGYRAGANNQVQGVSSVAAGERVAMRPGPTASPQRATGERGASRTRAGSRRTRRRSLPTSSAGHEKRGFQLRERAIGG